jgi:hypothetical protein
VEEHCDDLDYESDESEGGEDVICPDLRSSHIDPMRRKDFLHELQVEDTWMNQRALCEKHTDTEW